MKRSLLKYYIVITAALSAVTACNTTGCLDNQSALPLAGMYSSATEKPVTIKNVEISGVGAPGDSILLDKSKSVSEIYLPMRSTRQQTSWRLRYYQEGLEGIEDIITFDYESVPQFVSEECGAMYFYRITNFSYTENLIDSVAVTDSLITNVERERIRIYFRTANPDTPDEPETPETPDTPDEES
ncbi:MAG: hypothetical protein J6C95_08415 [Muribaculaceae bacterium]|nr:hypothetical protein [Muribaculaceae bacterium]